MNPKLAVLFEKYAFSKKDIYDFMQIYNLMPDYKKVSAIENFETIARSINILQEQVTKEHEILFGKTLENIQTRIHNSKRHSLIHHVR